MKQNFTKLKSSRKEAKNYTIFIDNKKTELEKLKAGNELFNTIKKDLEKNKDKKIEDYEKFYQEAQDSSKGEIN
jgi:hypothetical protein